MALVLLSTRTSFGVGLRYVSSRTLILYGIGACLLLIAAAFTAGMWMGRTSIENALYAQANTESSVSNQRFTLDRLGRITARLIRLEADAGQLLQRVSGMENIERKLSATQKSIGGTAVSPESLRNSKAGAGGPAYPVAVCGDSIHAAPSSAVPLSGSQRVDAAERSVSCLQKMIGSIESSIADRQLAMMALPIRLPVDGADVGSSFGIRMDPINGQSAFHSGLDFAAATGTPIYAAGGGRVSFAGYQNEMGNNIEIDHGNGLTTRYAHASRLYVKTGDIVAPRQLIAAIGTTGRSTGPHLHFEVLTQGRFVNPSYYLALGDESRR